jgi:hypothetical protein
MRSWGLVGAAALAVAGLFALLLACSRLPGIETVFTWPQGFFGKGLVIHVVFSLVVWFLVIFALLATLAAYEVPGGTTRLMSLGSAGPGLVTLAFPCLFLPAFLDETVASLNNYVPVIVHRAYYFGLVLLAMGVALPAIRLLANMRRPMPGVPPVPLAMAGCSLIFIAALVCIVAALTMSWGAEPARIFHEHLFWGGGHVLQFLNATVMMTCWFLLVRSSFGECAFDPAIFRLAVGLMVVFALSAPLLYAVFDAFSIAQTEAFRRLQMAVALPSALVAATGLLAIMTWRRVRRLPWREPAFLALALSMAVFGAGGIMGLMINTVDTRTPAHYHAMIAGVNLSIMGLFFSHILPAIGIVSRKTLASRLQIMLFGSGQLVACIGLFVAGGYGAPRKTPSGAAVLVDGAAAGMYLHGVGALVAVIGGVMFVFALVRSLAPVGPLPNLGQSRT